MKKGLYGLMVAVMLVAAPAILRANDASFKDALNRYYRGDYSGAVEEFQEVIEAHPNDAAAYYYMGYAYQEMGDYPAAREAFRKVYEIDPNFVPDVGK
jgi:tetratricopeptide (TPR) repeat protein